LTRKLLSLILVSASLAAAAPVLVLSIDGLDYRYLRDADRLGLKIPNLRRVFREGESAAGVVGVWPTVTWPSHTSMITGTRPDQHGIRGNRRPRSEGGDYYWSVSLLKGRTLWHATREAGLKSAAITWPVTGDADIDFNLPELFQKRAGGAMDMRTIEAGATPGLVDAISRMFPSFPREWMDDRARTLATIYLLKEKRPDLLLVHLVDHDAEAHERGPFSREANATMEYTDELLGMILAALPRDYVLALVSDHGFERIERIVNVPVLLSKAGVKGEVQVMGGVASSASEPAIAALRKLALDPASGVGREIPMEELRRHAPEIQGAAFEPTPGHLFGSGTEELYSTPREPGVHGLWPERRDYRAVFVLWGRGIKASTQPEMSMLSIASRVARLLGVRWP
jgi:predicted AlkP superfamily pyrophosphatase or phosphodiesterase